MCVKVEEEEEKEGVDKVVEVAEEELPMISGISGTKKKSFDDAVQIEALKKDDEVSEETSIGCSEEKKRDDDTGKCSEEAAKSEEDGLSEEPDGSPLFLKCNGNQRKSVSESPKDDQTKDSEKQTPDEKYKVEDLIEELDEIKNFANEESAGSPVFLKCKVKIKVEIEEESHQETDNNGNFIAREEETLTVEEKESEPKEDHVMIFHMEDVHDDERNEDAVEENPVFLKCLVNKRPSESSQGDAETIVREDEIKEKRTPVEREYSRNDIDMLIKSE